MNLNNWDDHEVQFGSSCFLHVLHVLIVLFGSVVSTVAISAMEVNSQVSSYVKTPGVAKVKCTASWLLVASLPEIFDTHLTRLLDRNDQASTCGWDSQELNC